MAALEAATTDARALDVAAASPYDRRREVVKLIGDGKYGKAPLGRAAEKLT